MEIAVCVIIGSLTVIIAVLLIKIYLMKKSAREIENAFADKLINDTNTLIGISSRDKNMRSLADSINIQLRILRAARHKFHQGDIAIKNAVTNISHDLRTPLTAVYGYLELLEKEEMSENARRYISIIKNRSEMLNQLTKELFSYSIVLTNENNFFPEPVIINSVLEESIAAFYMVLNARGITPNIKLSKNKIIRDIDRVMLFRIFENILNNAVKYSDGDLDIVLYETGKIIFSNSASGLDKIKAEKLFDRFYTVENAGSGTGLGLAIAKTLVERMNGSITADYTDNRLSIAVFFPNNFV